MSKNDGFDQSHLDRKYFVDTYKYNCPFCKRRHVSYSVISRLPFNWSNDRAVHVYRVKCESCNKISMHLSDLNIGVYNNRFWKINIIDKESGENAELFLQDKIENDGLELDNFFFYKRPTSFFTLDNRIHKDVRELIAEAQGCKDVGYLVGASGALRKAIYEFLKHEKTTGRSYEDRIEFLKAKHTSISSTLFDALASIQDMTSDNLHEKEGSWEVFTSEEFEYLIETFKKLLDAIYIKPDEDKKDMEKINALHNKLKNKSQETKIENTELESK